MSDVIKPVAEWCALFIEMTGIGVITITTVYVLIFSTVQLFRRIDKAEVFNEIRQRLGRGILLGLEFLIAADIIHTVVLELTFATVAVLGLIVLIRTFLSFALELELTGRWPWQGENHSG